MKRGSLFFIRLISAITTFVSLSFAFKGRGFYDEDYPYNHFHHHYYNKYYHDDYNTHDRDKSTINDEQSKADSAKRNY